MTDGPPSAAAAVDLPDEQLRSNPSASSVSNFPAIDPESDVDRLHSLPSLCMHCRCEGETRLLLHSIPYFRQVLLMSFSCPHCHHSSCEVQPASDIQPKARRFTLSIDHTNVTVASRSLNRQIVRSETAVLCIPELDFQISPMRTRGDINTVEGLLGNIADSLQVGQANRAIEDGDRWRKVATVIEEVQAMREGKRSFTLVIDDLAGNSFIENPYAPAMDREVKVETYTRTKEQTAELGYAKEEEERKEGTGTATGSATERGREGQRRDSTELNGVEVQSTAYSVSADVQDRVNSFINVSDRSVLLSSACPSCHRPCETRMVVTDIPHFKDVVLMTTQCDWCGYRDTEVKPAGRVSPQAMRITLQVKSVDDLKRDILKSDTASISIPELELDMMAGTLGGKYTTVEGLLHDVKAQLSTINPFQTGDSSDRATRQAFTAFLQRLDDCISVTSPFTLVLDDPLSNSHIFSPDPSGADAGLSVSYHERTWDQNEELGLNDVQVDVGVYGSVEDVRLFEEEMRREENEIAERSGRHEQATQEREKEREEGDEKEGQTDGVRSGTVGGNIHTDEVDR